MADFDEYKKTACGILLAGQATSFCEGKIYTSTLKATGGSTEELYEHLKRLHSCNLLKRKADDQFQSTTAINLKMLNWSWAHEEVLDGHG